tara:strand:- start:530 stop:1264 length:735 start_codon:yes stop_codon:yes gene_type:complete
MTKIEVKNLLANLINDSYQEKLNKFTLIVFVGLLGDFDSFEYAINITKFLNSNKVNNLDIFFIGIGNDKGKDKFSKYTGLPKNNIKVVNNNQLHKLVGAYEGLNIGLGGWINMTLMLMGIGSSKTLIEVIRGYTGDKGSNQIYYDFDQINLFNFFKFSGKLFEKPFGKGYLRPFELATFRLNNMIEIFKNWGDYMIDTKYLPQRSCTFVIDKNNDILYEYYSKDILNYSKDMKSPLDFLNKYIQ